ncbi:zinc finger protein 846 isoform X4 [Bicyclus anynana]|uniref:Zinc finger protein 846 isoform X4 n=1 Tax=Bicyclus anynana TaxID=110368 RepID=A0ABM3LST0_BICAN|nr:zinc finger protein 846 isoform X4 [Bicyclus anynana]
MEKVTLDITSVCRICFELKTDTRSLFTKENESSIHEKLVNHTNLDLHIDDGGPVTICEQCYEEFNVFVVFLDKCKRSNALFQQFKQNVKDSCDFDSSANYSIHADELNTKNTSKCNKDNLTPSVDTVPLKSAQSTSATHKCQLCCKVFTRKFNYKLHLKRHSGEREWQCARCGAATLTRVLALRHCSPGARRLCPAAGCGSSFTSATNLNIHIRRHNGERPYSCAECGKSFGSKNILSDHIRVHTENIIECKENNLLTRKNLSKKMYLKISFVKTLKLNAQAESISVRHEMSLYVSKLVFHVFLCSYTY